MKQINLMLINGQVINMDHVTHIETCDKHIIVNFSNGNEFSFDDPDEVAVLNEYLSGILPDIADPNTRDRLINISRIMRQQMFLQADKARTAMLSPEPEPADFRPQTGFAGYDPNDPGHGDKPNPRVKTDFADPSKAPKPNKNTKPGGVYGGYARSLPPSSVKPNPRGCAGCGKDRTNK